jgi:hypothetical protein
MITGIPLIDAAVAIGGLIIPPAYNFIKNKFGKSEDSATATMGNLATTKPEVLPDYTRALVELKDAEVRFFNRDVVGEVSPWVRDLRAAIRPATVVLGMGMLILHGGDAITLDQGIIYFLEANISSWFGSRLAMGGQHAS